MKLVKRVHLVAGWGTDHDMNRTTTKSAPNTMATLSDEHHLKRSAAMAVGNKREALQVRTS